MPQQKGVWMAQHIEPWPIKDLQPYEHNARTHTADQVEKVAASIREFGFTNPILIDKSNGVVAGHARLQAAKQLGLDEVPVVVLDHLTKTQRRAYVLADNQLATLSGWDDKLLGQELAALSIDSFDLPVIGFDDLDVANLLAGFADDGENDEEPEEASVYDSGRGSSGNPIIQYNIIFDDESQQQTWFDFLRKLKTRYSDQGTIAERLVRFINEG